MEPGSFSIYFTIALCVLAVLGVVLYMKSIDEGAKIKDRLKVLDKASDELELMKSELRGKVVNQISLLTSEVARIESIESQQIGSESKLASAYDVAAQVKSEVEQVLVRLKQHDQKISAFARELQSVLIKQQKLVHAFAIDKFFALTETRDVEKRKELLIFLRNAADDELMEQLEPDLSDTPGVASAVYILSESEERQNRYADKMIGFLDRADNSDNTDSARQIVRDIFRMLEEAQESGHPAARLLGRLARYATRHDDLPLSEETYNRLTKLHSKLGNRVNSPFLRSGLIQVAELFERKGQKDNLESLYKHIHELFIADSESDRCEMAGNIKKLALMYVDRSLNDEAVAMYDSALNLLTQAQGPSHKDVIEHLREFARLHVKLGNGDGACRLYLRLLTLPDIQTNDQLTPIISEVTASMESLADKTSAVQVAKIYQACLHAIEGTEGETQLRSTLPVLKQLLLMYDKNGNQVDFAMLEETCRRSLRTMEALGQAGNAEHRELVLKLAQLYNEHRQYEKSTELLEKATSESDSKADPAELLQLIICRAKSESGMGRYSDAEGALKKFLELHKENAGLPDQELIELFAELGVVASLMKHDSEAEEYFKKELAAVEQSFGADDTRVVTPLTHLAGLCMQKGQWAQAEQFYQRILDTKKKQLGEEHEDIVATLATIAELQRVLKKFDESEQSFELSLKLAEKSFGAGSPRLGDLLEKYAALSEEAGQRDKAKSLLSRVNQIRRASV